MSANKIKVISELVNELSKIIEKEMPEEYANALENAKQAFEYKRNYKSKEKYVQRNIKSWIRDLIKNDYKSLAGKMSEDVILSYDKEEIKQLLKVLFFLRKKNGDFFYRKNKGDLEGEQISATKSISANLTKGSLAHDYEEYANQIIKEYNYQFGKNIFDLYEEFENEKEYLKALEEVEEELVINLRKENEENFEDCWFDFLKFLDILYEKVSKRSELCKRKNMLIYLFEVERLAGIIRKVLYEIQNSDSNCIVRKIVIDRYIDLLKSNLNTLQSSEKENYSLIQNYILHIAMISIRKEREAWLKIFEFLFEEEEVGNIDGDIHLDERRFGVCNTIRKWYIEERQVIKEIDRELLMRAIYKEIYVYKKVPSFVSAKGWRHFLNYIEKVESRNSSNMNLQELFYFEKIRRGVYRECGALEEYKNFNYEMRKLYKLEISMFSDAYMKGGYLGNWIKVMKDSLEML